MYFISKSISNEKKKKTAGKLGVVLVIPKSSPLSYPLVKRFIEDSGPRHLIAPQPASAVDWI